MLMRSFKGDTPESESGTESPAALEYIRHLNYEKLENQYDIHKYVPRYIHNGDCTTPDLKDLICTKPIYSEVNKKAKKKHKKHGSTGGGTGGGKTGIAASFRREIEEISAAFDEELVFTNPWDRKELKQVQREVRRELKEAHREDKEAHRDDKRELRDDRNQMRHDHRDDRKQYKQATALEARAIKLSRSLKQTHLDIHELHSHQQTRLERNSRVESNFSQRYHEPAPRHGSVDHRAPAAAIAARSIPDSDMVPLVKSNSYDQTKSIMTTQRKHSKSIKQRLLGFSLKRRNSEQIEVVTETVKNGYTGQDQQIQYTQSQMVGHGSFGVVFQTHILPTNEIAAMKRVLQDKRFKNRELQIMKLVHHRNIADLKYYFYTNTDKNELYLNLILEFVPETLYKASHYYVSKRVSMPPLEVKLYTYQMFRALNYIHSLGICHRDIKPQNLLINPETGELKLCDFGSAKILNPAEPNVSYICSRYYRAPELIFGATNYTTKIDVWSAGCVMAELILGQPLFPGESGIDQLVEIIKILGTPSKDQIKNMNPNYMEHKFPQIKPVPLQRIFKKMTLDCINFLIRVLQYSPVDRISCVEAMVDPYFDELRNESLQLPNYRKIFSQEFHSSSQTSRSSHSNNANYQIYANQPDMRPIPELFDFDDRELSVMPVELRDKLVPAFAFSRLRLTQQVSNLLEFVPWTKEQLQHTLE